MVSQHAVLHSRGPLLSKPRGRWPPVFAARAKGARLWDVDGREYIDFILAFGAIVLGHADERVDDRVIVAIRNGVAPTLNTRREVELAERLCAVQPTGDRSVVFLRTGSDATSAAVRLARSYTGRSRVIRCGYNGWHDWCAPRSYGVPSQVQALTTVIPYNDLEAARAAVGAAGADLACIITIPMEVDPPRENFLHELRQMAKSAASVFILDEIRTGFRLGSQGAQGHFGIQADLVVYSKAMANGYSISAVVGNSAIMAEIGRISLSSLFYRSVDGFAAALATTNILYESAVAESLWQKGTYFQNRLRDLAASTGLPVEVVGLPVMPFHRFTLLEALAREANEVFAAEAACHGVLFHPQHHWFVSHAMTQEDLDRAIEAAAAGYSAVAQSLERAQ